MNELDVDISAEEKEHKHEIHIENFDGPLDLLWDLIKKSKIDITEISLSSITEQYIHYLKLMEKLNVKIAVEFIWMASELLYYKSRALLPAEAIEDEYFVPPLPPELIQKLLEYKKYQQASADLRMQYDFHCNTFIRECGVSRGELGEEEEYIEVSLFDLLKAFAEVLESQTEIEQEEILFDEILVSDRIEYIKNLLKENTVILFADIFGPNPGRIEIISTFLAILEMAKVHVITIMQNSLFGDIRLIRNFQV